MTAARRPPVAGGASPARRRSAGRRDSGRARQARHGPL